MEVFLHLMFLELLQLLFCEQVPWSTGSSRCRSPMRCMSHLPGQLTTTSHLRWRTPTA
jgi:hypothetical protein